MGTSDYLSAPLVVNFQIIYFQKREKSFFYSKKEREKGLHSHTSILQRHPRTSQKQKGGQEDGQSAPPLPTSGLGAVPEA